MKLSYSFNKLMILILNIMIISGLLTIGYFVIYGLIIEPNLPMHYYGVGDLAEFLYSAGVSIIIVLIFRIRNFYLSLEFLGHQISLSSLWGIRHFVFFNKIFSRERGLIFDNKLTDGKDPDKIYLIHGICLGNIFRKSYFFGYSFSKDNVIKIYKVLFSGKIPVTIKICSVPTGSACQFLMEYKYRSFIIWSVATKGRSGYIVDFYEEMMVHNRNVFGMWVDDLTSTPLKIND